MQHLEKFHKKHINNFFWILNNKTLKSTLGNCPFTYTKVAKFIKNDMSSTDYSHINTNLRLRNRSAHPHQQAHKHITKIVSPELLFTYHSHLFYRIIS